MHKFGHRYATVGWVVQKTDLSQSRSRQQNLMKASADQNEGEGGSLVNDVVEPGEWQGIRRWTHIPLSFCRSRSTKISQWIGNLTFPPHTLRGVIKMVFIAVTLADMISDHDLFSLFCHRASTNAPLFTRVRVIMSLIMYLF